MADNIPIAGGYVVGTKEIGGVHYQKTTLVDQAGAEISPATAAKQDAAVTELEAQSAELVAIKNLLSDTGYEPVAASQTAAPIGAATAGVLLSQLVIQPTSIAPGAVTLLDGSTPVYVWPGTSAHPAHLPPVVIPLGIASVDGWALTTGVDVEVLAVGDI